MLPSYADYFALIQCVFQGNPGEMEEELTTIVRDHQAAGPPAQKDREGGIPVITTGSPVASEQVYRIIEEAGFNILYNDSCLDQRWAMRGSVDPGQKDIFSALSSAYLSGTPCARMYERKTALDRMTREEAKDAEGIIHFRMPSSGSSATGSRKYQYLILR